MLPTPTFNFTIPSIHDDITLQCRIYHPLRFLHNGAVGQPGWRKKGAIIAHPYAPLGGCYDDPVVRAAAIEILKKGFVVGTFNFRGAGDSKGRTSWTARPELSDYISFARCFIDYLNHLDPPTPFPALEHSRSQSDTTLSPIQSSVNVPTDRFDAPNSSMVLILGGYSYGSMICTHLPTTETIVQRFASVAKGSAEAEIRLRSLHLSTQWNKEARLMNETRRGRSLRIPGSLQDPSRSISMGGDESEPGTRRPSRESKRSLDHIRRSMDRSKKRLGIGNHSSTEIIMSPSLEGRTGPELTTPTTYYLLISPLLPPVSMFATMFSKLKRHQRASLEDSAVANTHVKDKLTSCATLAIYGDKDFFTSPKKLRKWAEHLAGAAESRFRFREIGGAGHFWHEPGVEGQMRSAIRDWTQDILECSRSCPPDVKS
ncbi:Alpha/Beta hydrolase fold [Lasallia pustulata]|uniref:Alpha/Beta hydrolase fold n=1 Tax=Lasallia pustulata TaxID=136370 RepID=A0A1W5DAH2_9LECA|nr:Alpha/Beta hydrolase fold [Lasallia pustulata]